MMTTDREAAAWRRETRARLLAARAALSPEEHARKSGQILANLRARWELFAGKVVGAYLPLGGELDPVPFLALLERTALPVIPERKQPLEFHAWRPDEPTRPGPFGTQHPERETRVQPEVLLIPVVGFDGEHYRLGYGGGYYDRTLAALQPRPFTVGVGFELGRLPTIRPQSYDIPLDLVVTEI